MLLTFPLCETWHLDLRHLTGQDGKPIHLPPHLPCLILQPRDFKAYRPVDCGCPHTTPSWQVQGTEAHPTHNTYRDVVREPYGPSQEHANFMLISAFSTMMPTGSRPAFSVSANLGSIQIKFNHLQCFFLSQVGCPVANLQHYSYTATIKTSTREGENMYIIHICPPGRQAVRANERLKLWSHGALSEVNGMN